METLLPILQLKRIIQSTMDDLNAGKVDNLDEMGKF